MMKAGPLPQLHSVKPIHGPPGAASLATTFPTALILMSVPTIEQVLSAAHTANGHYLWGVDGGTVTLTREQLLPALEDAYDSSMPEWPTMVDLVA